MNTTLSKTNDAKKIFKKKGTCSNTFAFLLNREFGNLNDSYEGATDPLAGGVMRKGHQCGMLWGSVLALGAEAFRRSENKEDASVLAIKATQDVVKSFKERTSTVNCREITGCKMDNFFGMTSYMIKVMLKGMNNSKCFNLAENWAPDAIQSAKIGLDKKPENVKQECINCASKVAKKMGATDKEMAMVSGFAGGMGLSGNGCGALAAAIWMNSLKWQRINPDKSAFGNPIAKSTLKRFLKETKNEMLCHIISGQQFKTVKEHSNFIKQGGCEKLLNRLSEVT